jgi:hypothetical protein
MSMTPIDELIEIWVRAHKEVLATTHAHDDDLSWWREALAKLRPTPEDDAILEAEEENRPAQDV